MTNMAEAKLAREAEICFATLAMITDYDCWYISDNVSVDTIIQNLVKNTGSAKNILSYTIKIMPELRDCSCGLSLKDAVITAKDAIPDSVKQKLGIIISKYL
jgi:5'-methylthioadenosine phosphorylase